MQLEQYGKKRDFNQTPEPAPKEAGFQEVRPCFVVQKHQASHLHYDLRLELDGVLKSWAVPKGPSLDANQKRLAMMVEDHPFDYRDFEGIIPEGNYGAGTVMVWDRGFYSIPGIEGKQETEEALRSGLSRGNAFFSLDGQKLKGMFHLVRMSAKGENTWLMLKKSDHYSVDKYDVLLHNRSVRSGLTLEEIRAQTMAGGPLTITEDQGDPILRDAARKEFTGPVRPMLAQLIQDPFDREGWIFEIKWDGYRAIAECLHGAVSLYSRNGHSFSSRYPAVLTDLHSIRFEAVLDGEIVVLDQEGRSDFGALQNYRKKAEGLLVYYVFDMLYFEGYDLTGLPLSKRKSLLHSVLPKLDHVKINEHIKTAGRDFYEAAKQLGLEGVVAKDSGSPYVAGNRSWYWQKLKILKQQEAIVAGFTEPKGSRKSLGSLILGVYDSNRLVYIGNVGGGFSEDELVEVRDRLNKLEIEECPLYPKLPAGQDSHWVKPELVCMVRFSEWTSDGRLRQPIFLGFREDIDPGWVRREEPSKPQGRFPPLSRDQKLNIDGRSVIVTNPHKVYWPDESITKGEMIEYYRSISAWIIPHLLGRPQSLHRFPDGIKGKHFFHKDLDIAPDWAQTVVVESDERAIATRYLICKDEATLVFMLNLGSIEINPWISRVSSLDNPDFMVIDLDPLYCPFDYVVKTAAVVHAILQEIDVPHYVKTSGATGLHIFVPLEARYSYEQSRQFAMLVSTAVSRELPSITSLERLPNRREGRVYLDYLQNIKGKTMASVYSLRPHPGAPVSTPLHWEEVNEKLDPSVFNIHTTRKRLEQMGDLFRPVLGRGIDMKLALERLKSIFDRLT